MSEKPRPGEFCEAHFSWLCQAGQGKCQDAPDRDYEYLDRRTVSNGAHTRIPEGDDR